MLRSYLVSAALVGAGCKGDGTHTVLVDLKTDLVAGTEFASVTIAGESGGGFRQEQTRQGRFGEDYLAGHRVAELDGVPTGTLHLEVSVKDGAGARVVGRTILLTVRNNTVVTAVLTRDCREIMCPLPDGDPAFTACLNGRCADPRCTPEALEFCGESLCGATPECGEAATSCATRSCEGGLCLSRSSPNACAAGEVCDLDVGCRPAAPPDGGDGGVDAMSVDPTAPTDCAVQRFTLARAGTSSSCGFDLPAELDDSLLNVFIESRPGVQQPVCRIFGSGSCAGGPGWWVSAGSVALCDQTCGDLELTAPDGSLIGELGCTSSFCTGSCNQYNETCGGARDCCPGYACTGEGDRCEPCLPTGTSCTVESADACCGGTCEGGRCCYPSLGPCRSDDDCCSGTCGGGLCQA